MMNRSERRLPMEIAVVQDSQQHGEHDVRPDAFENIAHHVERLKQIRATMHELRSRLTTNIEKMLTSSDDGSDGLTRRS